MRGKRLTEFCEALCQAICRGAATFRFEGAVFTVESSMLLCNEWIEAEEQGAQS